MQSPVRLLKMVGLAPLNRRPVNRSRVGATQIIAWRRAALRCEALRRGRERHSRRSQFRQKARAPEEIPAHSDERRTPPRLRLRRYLAVFHRRSTDLHAKPLL